MFIDLAHIQFADDPAHVFWLAHAACQIRNSRWKFNCQPWTVDCVVPEALQLRSLLQGGLPGITSWLSSGGMKGRSPRIVTLRPTVDTHPILHSSWQKAPSLVRFFVDQT